MNDDSLSDPMLASESPSDESPSEAGSTPHAVKVALGLAAAFGLAPVAGMVLIFAFLPALPIALFVGFVCLPDHLERITSERRARHERELEARRMRRALALEREARLYGQTSALGGRAHA